MKGRLQTICRSILCFTILFESGLSNVYSQNLVPNYSFEEITYCPTDIFSPNGDGLNDIFNITFSNNSEIESGSIVIYDRWGDQVYSSNAITFVWDGTKNGKEVNPGVYAYRMKLNYIDQNVKAEEWITGEVTLIK